MTDGPEPQLCPDAANRACQPRCAYQFQLRPPRPDGLVLSRELRTKTVRAPTHWTRVEAQTHYSRRSVADAAANHDILTEPVDPVFDDGSATAVVFATVVTVVPVRADIDAAGTDAKLNSVS